MSEINQLPKLFMRRKNLNNLPQIKIPTGFNLRHYRTGDDECWEKIIEAALGKKNFTETIKSHTFFTAQRVLFICDNEKPIATATAWLNADNPKSIGQVHMVGVYPEFRGKGLGFQIILATLHQMKREGKRGAALLTDDSRLSAISIYLKLGFEPECNHESNPQRWQNIYENIRGHVAHKTF